jgi:Leucine-rich repeat (LRR) protein
MNIQYDIRKHIMKHSLSRLLLTLSLSLLMVTSSLWASNSTLEDEQAPASCIQTAPQVLLSKEDRKAQLLAQKVDQYPTISCDENNLENKIYMPNEIMFLIMDHMEPQVFGNFLVTSQSSFELARDFLKERGQFITKLISSKTGIEAYRKSCLLGTLPHVSLKFYDGKDLPEEAKTALHSLAMKNNVLLNSDITFLSYLTNLRTLNVEDNCLSEHVTALTGLLTNLHTLNVKNNDLGEHLTAITGLLTNLHTLDVGYNDLREHVAAITGLLTNLHTLNVMCNSLGEHVTAFTGLLTNLHTLNVSAAITSVSMSLHLQALLTSRTLNVVSNKLDEHVTAFTGLTNLRILNVGDNNLGEHVAAIAGLTNLRTLDVWVQ